MPENQIISKMSNHDTNQDTNQEPQSFSERFVPLSDNNSNLSLGKVITLMVSLALIVYGLLAIVESTGGYLTNEQQIEWRKEHHKPMKDSDENKHAIPGENSENQEK